MSGLPLAGLLLVFLTCLLFAQLFLVVGNITTREHIHWIRKEHTTSGVPMPGSKRWAEYAPHDKGCVRNVLAFLTGSREPKTDQPRDIISQGDEDLHSEEDLEMGDDISSTGIATAAHDQEAYEEAAPLAKASRALTKLPPQRPTRLTRSASCVV
uniref:Protein S-acyltransferase n=1 Tax=Haptolina brevifila TaxID=156173 RepID=A0A7S2JLF4_9EUKA